MEDREQGGEQRHCRGRKYLKIAQRGGTTRRRVDDLDCASRKFAERLAPAFLVSFSFRRFPFYYRARTPRPQYRTTIKHSPCASLSSSLSHPSSHVVRCVCAKRPPSKESISPRARKTHRKCPTLVVSSVKPPYPVSSFHHVCLPRADRTASFEAAVCHTHPQKLSRECSLIFRFTCGR